MARTHARIFCSIWNDPIFTSLSAEAQRLYLLALSQPNISLCGVVPFTARRWARFSPDTKAEDLEDAVVELENAGLVLLDNDTEELWVKSFVRYDGILGNSKLVKGMEDALSTVLSPKITAAHRQKYEHPEQENQPGIAHPEQESDPETISGTSSAFTSSISTSSSSPPLPPDEEESLRAEAQRRLEARVRARGPVLNPEGWLRTTLAGLRRDWKNAHEAGLRSEAERRRVASCERCNGQGVWETDAGYVRCDHDAKAAG